MGSARDGVQCGVVSQSMDCTDSTPFHFPSSSDGRLFEHVIVWDFVLYDSWISHPHSGPSALACDPILTILTRLQS
jgi:hypothetical protein